MSHLDPEALELLAQAPPAPLEGHLAACPACARQLEDARARRALLAGLQPYTLSDLAFRRVEARLREAVESGALQEPSWRWALRWGALPAALALGAALAVSWSRPVAAPPPAVVARAAAPASVARVEALTAVLASGDARVRRGEGPWRALTAGGEVEAGEALAASRVVLSAGPEVAWALELSGEASVGGTASLTLGLGQVRARVSGPRLDLQAGGLRVQATEAVFSVDQVAAEVVVEVAEGWVDLVDASSARRTLRAPARLRWAEGTAVSASPSLAPRGVEAPRLPLRPWAALDASGLPAGTRLSLDGAALGEAPFSALATEGRHRLGVAPPGGVARESWVALTGGTRLPLGGLPEVEPQGPEPDAAAVARAQVALRAALPRLAACYEQWLKANPQATAQVELHLTVAPSGKVQRAQVVGGGLPGASAECLVRTAKRLSLPALGAEVELQVPLRLTTQRE